MILDTEKLFQEFHKLDRKVYPQFKGGLICSNSAIDFSHRLNALSKSLIAFPKLNSLVNFL